MSPRSIPLSALPDDVKKRLRSGNRQVAKGHALKLLRAEQAKAKHEQFYAMLDRAKIPHPVTEWRFHAERRWRFDYAWIDAMVAVEVEGGAWTQGRHTRGKGFVADMQKYNSAALLGWRVLRVTPDQLTTRGTEEMLRRVLRAGVSAVGGKT